MANKKYSIPSNYAVLELNGLKGIMRRDKKGDKWTWDPFYSVLLVGKSYGKILVAYREATSQDQFIRISSYNKKDHMPIEAYDVLFGENCLYVKTFRNSTGESEWCLVREDMGGGKFLGDFEFTNRDRTMPFHIPIGTTEMKIKLPDGTIKKLKLLSGDIVDDDSLLTREKPKVEEPPVTHYNILINTEDRRLKLLNAANNKLVKESICIGEIETYKPILTQLLGKLEGVEKETGDLLVTFLAYFEHYVHGIVIPIIFDYVKTRGRGKHVNEILRAMINEAGTGWFKGDNGKEFKVYTEGVIILVMHKLKNNRITVAPYIIENGDDILSTDELKDLVELYQTNGINNARLTVTAADLDEVITDESELKQWPSPYSVQQRIAFASDIKQFTYTKINIYVLNAVLVAENLDTVGKIVLNVALCEDFTYKPKKKISGKTSEWVKTNTSAAQII